MRFRLIALLWIVAAPALGQACSIPVFRYALERWELSKYEITVFYERVLPPDLDKALKALEANPSKANITIARVDLQGNVAPEYAKQWALQTKEKTLPWLSARLPETDARMPDSWAGPFTEENLRRVIDSPVRQQLVKRLSQGTTAVFLLLPGQNEEANVKAVELLDKELARLGKIAQLPDLRAEDQLRFGVPLKIDFVMLKLKRDDPAEQAFIKSLLNSEEDLSKVRGPIVLPVFGRGRLLCSLFGEDLTRESLANVVRFICGECSCQVKELNPGVDLLLAANWADILEKSGPPVIPMPKPPAPMIETKTPNGPSAPMSSSPNGQDVVTAAYPTTVVEAEPNVVVLPSIPEDVITEPGESCPIRSHCWLFIGLCGAGALVVATGFWVFMQRK